MIYVSLKQIKSFDPCYMGWKILLTAKQRECYPNDLDKDELFPISFCIGSNSISDVCWLLGKLGRQDILKRFARKCADSVKHLQQSKSAVYAAYAAAAAAAYADAYAAASYAYAADAAAYAAADAAAADAASCADASCADAAASCAYAAAKQNKLEECEKFLLETISELS